MNFRPAKRYRKPAVAMQPIIDPAGWTAEQMLRSDEWIYYLSKSEISEILSAVDTLSQQNVGILGITRENFSLPNFDKSLALLREELLFGRGFFLLRGLPVDDMGLEAAGMAFWGLATRFGYCVSQNPKGHMLGHVKDFGGDYHDPKVRGYQTSVQMNYHSDQCDNVWLMCMHPARSGGESLIASTITVYNHMLKERPELVQALIADFYQTKHGEVAPGEDPFYKLPVFSFKDGYFSGRGPGIHLLKAFDLPGVPPATEHQKEAFPYFQKLAGELSFPTTFRKGDIQVLHSHVTVHTRTAFQDFEELEKKRHLMRLWVVDDHGRPLVPGFRENFCGIEIPGVQHSAPLNVFEAA